MKYLWHTLRMGERKEKKKSDFETNKLSPNHIFTAMHFFFLIEQHLLFYLMIFCVPSSNLTFFMICFLFLFCSFFVYSFSSITKATNTFYGPVCLRCDASIEESGEKMKNNDHSSVILKITCIPPKPIFEHYFFSLRSKVRPINLASNTKHETLYNNKW